MSSERLRGGVRERAEKALFAHPAAAGDDIFDLAAASNNWEDHRKVPEIDEQEADPAETELVRGYRMNQKGLPVSYTYQSRETINLLDIALFPHWKDAIPVDRGNYDKKTLYWTTLELVKGHPDYVENDPCSFEPVREYLEAKGLPAGYFDHYKVLEVNMFNLPGK